MILRRTNSPLIPTHQPSLAPLLGVPLRAAALGLFVGLASACVVSVHDDWWDAQEECFDEYGDCMDDAYGPGDAAACEQTLDACLEACDGGKDDDGDSGRADSGGSGDSGDSADDDPRTDDGDDGGEGDGEGDGDETTGDGDGDGPDPACFAIHATCVAEAETLQDIEACEALFDNCIDPGPCESEECEPGCPQAELDACVEGYADCAAAAVSAEDMLACEAEFDGCIAEFDVALCLPGYDDDLVLECLAQHELCVACADDADELGACKTAFDNCLEG